MEERLITVACLIQVLSGESERVIRDSTGVKLTGENEFPMRTIGSPANPTCATHWGDTSGRGITRTGSVISINKKKTYYNKTLIKLYSHLKQFINPGILFLSKTMGIKICDSHHKFQKPPV